MKFLTPVQVADILQLPDEWDRAGWVVRRCRRGDFPGAKRISRGVWRIPTSGLDAFMAQPVEPAAEVEEPEVAAVSIQDALSARSSRRKRSA